MDKSLQIGIKKHLQKLIHATRFPSRVVAVPARIEFHAEIHVFELPKLHIEQLQNTIVLEKWLLFLKGNQQTKEVLATESSTMKEAYEEIRRLSQDPKTRHIADS